MNINYSSSIHSNLQISSIKIITLKLDQNNLISQASPSFFNEGFFILKLETKDGISGLGEPSTYGDNLQNCINFVKKYLSEIIVEKNIGEVWNDLGTLQINKSKISEGGYASIIAALSQAILDLHGQEKGIPIWKMFDVDKKDNSYFNQKVYASGGMYYDDQKIDFLIDEAHSVKNKGYRAWKFRPPIPKNMSHTQRLKNPPDIDINSFCKIIPKIREAVGKDFDLMIDFGCRLKKIEDIKYILDLCKEYNFFFLEEPVSRNLNSYSNIKKITSCKIACGEHLFSNKEILEWCKNSSFDVFQPDVNFVGFQSYQMIRDTKKLNKSIIIHNWANGVSNYANYHFSSLIGDVEYVEKCTIPNPLRDELLNEELNIKQGIITLSNKPGLGISLDKKILKQYLFEL